MSQYQAEKVKDESSTEREEEHYEVESYDPPVEFEDPMFELMQEELGEEYDDTSKVLESYRPYGVPPNSG